MIEDALGLLGTTIADKYDVERVVGEGGFAVVYRAEHRLWKRPVALKVFKALADLPEHAREELTQNFIREGALLAELSEKSASICQARDVGVLTTASGVSVPYMVLEWLEGESLEDALQREKAEALPPRSLPEAIRLLEPVADALALAHARGIAHRDVKPANIFLLGGARDERCPVKLLDFGIAKVVQDMQKVGGAFTKTSGTLTSFTPAYAAPEQFARAHGPTGPWTDVFALALVVTELVTGKAPLDGDNFLQLGFAAGDKNIRPTPRTHGADITDAVEAVFQRALAVDRLERFSSADAFWRELRTAAGLGRSSMFEASAPLSLRGPVSTVVPHSSTGSNVDAIGRTVSIDAQTTTAVSSALLAAAPLTPSAPSAGAVSPRASKNTNWLLIVGAPLLVAIGFAGVQLAGGSKGAHVTGDAPSSSVAILAPSAGSPSARAASSSAAASVVPGAVASSGPAGSCPEGMAYVPGGPFYMGSDEGLPPEKPAHRVKLAPYCMDVFEVTTAKYVTCSDGGWCKRAGTTNIGQGLEESEHEAYDAVCNERDAVGRAQHPINCVTWEMADTYCRNVHGRRLPTEAEWEFAARGSDGRPYPWGDAIPDAHHLNACGAECAAWGVSAKVAPLKPMYPEDDRWPNTAPVGSFPEGRSKFGIMDLAGNVWEWVGDWYGPYAPGDPAKPLEQPTGPEKGTTRVIRGGAWNGSEASWERPSFRYSKEPTDRNHGVGFRCAADPG